MPNRNRTNCTIIIQPAVAGRCAASVGRSRNSCPYNKYSKPYKLWMNAYDKRTKEGPAEKQLCKLLMQTGQVNK